MPDARCQLTAVIAMAILGYSATTWAQAETGELVTTIEDAFDLLSELSRVP